MLAQARIDLHLHTTWSDGTLEPEELVYRAKRFGLCALALTDHDEIRGIPRAVEVGKKVGIQVIAGVELTCCFEPGSLHLLGYYIDLQDQRLVSTLSKLRALREERNQKMLDRCQQYGFAIGWDDLHAVADSAYVGRPHFARLLVQKGYAKDFYDAFERYLGKGRDLYVDRKTLQPVEAIDLIHGAKGIPVLAHPSSLQLDRDRFHRLLLDLKDRGLCGLEVYHSRHSPRQEALYRLLARRHGLLMTGGSDFHGENKPGVEVGRGFGDLVVPQSLLAPLQHHAEAKY